MSRSFGAGHFFMRLAYGDFETRSTLDLKEVGLDNYAKHPTTNPWCFAWALGDEEIEIWTPGFSMPERLRKHLESGGLFLAHNCHFEKAIWDNILVPRYGWGALPIQQCRCSMAMAYAAGLPGDLERAAAAAGIQAQKDMAGRRLMLQMSRPKIEQPLTWWDDTEHLTALYEYCKQDVRVERELEKRLLPLSESEQKLWELDYQINNRGIYVDTKTITAGIAAVESEADRLNKEIRTLTGNYVGFTTEVARIKAWLATQGIALDGVAKAEVVEALDLDTLPDICRQVLLIRQEAGKTSTAKLNTMLTARSADGRIKNTMQYYAAHTGRWAGRRIQPQNLPRPKLSQKEIETILDFLPALSTANAIDRIELLYGSVTHVMSDCIRGMITAAPGNVLIAGDYANIEGRGIAWLAGEEWKLDAFRAQDAKTGPEIYKLAAAKIYHKAVDEITKDERQRGKTAELACGYQGGIGAFQRMAKTSGVKVPDSEAQTIKAEWRGAHPKIVQYWWDLERAAYEAVCHPGTTTSAGPITRAVAFRMKGSFLFCKLPSGRLLSYPYPKLKVIDTPWGETKEQVHYMTMDGLTNKWIETHTYGGKLAENITQAICRDILAAAIVRLEGEGLPIIFHVHDEIVCELPEKSGEYWAPVVLDRMSIIPKWAEGLPIVIEGWTGRRYRK